MPRDHAGGVVEGENPFSLTLSALEQDGAQFPDSSFEVDCKNVHTRFSFMRRHLSGKRGEKK